ncbi:MAG: Lrp/AsnC family transcriptional regulator [Candidatus Bathyarchaeia archaeon]|jgi:DNA-binding Lrp family transcriptional regulator
METAVEIDEIDRKILFALIQDARSSLKNIAEKCDISSVSVLKRIKHLKDLGVITGATLFTSLDKIGFHAVATIGMETDSNPEEITEFLEEHTHLIEPSTMIGEYDFCALVYAEDITSLNLKINAIRKKFGIEKIAVNIWSGIPQMNFENIDLNPIKKR